jgi:hypothetical protein
VRSAAGRHAARASAGARYRSRRDRCASWRGVLLGERVGRPPGPGVTSPATASGADRGDVGPIGSYRPPHLRHPVGFPLHDSCPDVTVDACALQEQYGSSGSGHSREVGRAAPAGPPPVRLQDRVQCPAEGGQVSDVDTAVAQLTGELTEQPRPIPAGRLERYMDLDPPLDHLHRRPAGGRRAALFPGSMPAGGRAPLRDRAAAARGDRFAAPSTGRRGGASFGPVRHSAGLARTRAFYRGVLQVLAGLLLARSPSGLVLRTRLVPMSPSCRRSSDNPSPRVPEPEMSSYVSRRPGSSVRVGGGCGGLTAAKSRSGTESLSRTWLRPLRRVPFVAAALTVFIRL